jgi:hypothetical protein
MMEMTMTARKMTSQLQDDRLVVTELPDPTLQGKFPVEEMQIMSHLAWECLQWDPEARLPAAATCTALAATARTSPSISVASRCQRALNHIFRRAATAAELTN